MESFGKYLLLEKVAAGGMAEVFLAKSSSDIGKYFAIKRILPQYSSNQDFTDMFREEAKIAMNLSHSNIVSIFEFGKEKGQLFLVMDFVRGQNLRQVLNHLKKEGRKLSTDQILYIVREIAAGLDHAHRCLDHSTGKPLNITHRDMSPQNVMVSFDGEIKIVDFGIAKAESQVEHTRAGTIKGKFGYMSPEQADGQIVDPRTDIFSLGIIFWELLAQDRLFTGPSDVAILKKIKDGQIPSLSQLNPSIDPELEKIVNKALAKDKAHRYQTAAAFHKDLNRYFNIKYPEFSVQEFSVFIKSSYAQMFLELTNKLKQYANLKPAEKKDESTVVTSTGTSTETDAMEDAAELGLDLHAATQSQVDLQSMKINKKGPSRGPSTMGPQHASTNSGHTQTGFTNFSKSAAPLKTTPYYDIPQRRSSFDWTQAILIMMLVVGTAWYYVNQMGGELPVIGEFLKRESFNEDVVASMTTTVPVGQFESASTQKYSVHILSQPSMARIFIDGKDTGLITPAKVQVDANKEFKIQLRREGFDLYERIDRATENAYTLRATLIPREPMGFVTINVKNGGSQPKLYVNDLPFDEKLPITRMAVRADRPLRVRAVNEFAQLGAEEIIIVRPDQHKEVNLILKRTSLNNR